MSVGTLFDGTDDNIRSGTGTDLTLSTLKVAVLANWSAAPVGFDSIVTLYTAAATPSVSIYYDTASTTLRVSADASGGGFSALSFTPTVGLWYLFIVTKASGTATPRFHRYDGTSWTHTNGDTAIATGSGAITDLRIGSDDSGSGAPFAGDIALCGIGTGNSDDTACESFLNYSTLAGESWQFFTGTSLQNAGTMNDSGAGNNDETARTGTAVGRYQLPNWFTNFDATPAPEFKTLGARTTTGTTSCAIAVPSGIVANNMLLVGSVGKPSTATTTNPPASGGFSAIDNTTGGGGTQGTDTGPQRLATAYKDAAGGEGTLTYTWASSPNSVTGLMARYEKVSGGTWVTPVAVTADDSSAGTSFSATSGGTLALAPGDTVAAIFGGSTDATTAYTAAGFTSSGITFSTPIIRANAGGAGTGQDIGQMWTEAQVISGTGTSAVTVTLTGGPTSSGPVHIIRLRATVGGGATNADAGTGTSTGTSNNGSANVAPNGGTATSTGTGNQPAAKVNPNAGQAAATGVANNPTITASSNVPGGTATATGVANDATTSSSGQATNAPAGHAAGTGAADTASTSIGADAGDAGITYVGEAGFVTNTTAGSFDLVDILDPVPAGDTLVMFGAFDNAGTGGAAVTPDVVTVGTANTWTVYTPTAIADPGAANEGAQGFFAVCTVEDPITADSIIISFGVSVTAKAIAIHQFTGVDLSTPVLPSSYATQDNQTGQSVSVAAGTAPTWHGQIVAALVAVEGGTADSFTQDTDTTGGAWVTLDRHGAGTTTSGITLNSAYKLTTAAGAQTYDHATMLGTSRDHCAAILVLESPGAAWAIGVANDATVSTQSNTNAPAGHAAATGVAENASTKVSPNAGTATATGTANAGVAWPYLDSFTYTNGDLDTRAPLRWETITGNIDGWGAANGPLVVSSNQVTLGAAGEMNLMISPVGGSFPWDNQYAEVDYNPNGATTFWGVGVGVRATGNTGPAIEGYHLWAYLLAGDLILRLDRVDDGVATPIDQAVLPDSNAHTIKIEAIGNSIKGYLDDVEMVSATDSGYPTARGYFAGAYSSAGLPLLDNFEAGQPVAAGSANAGHAAATGTADTSSTKVSPNAGTATATGVGNNASNNVAPNAGHAAATGVANNATVQTSAAGSASAGHATGTGTADNPAAKVNPNVTAGTATGTANNATVSTNSDKSVDAGHAAATGVANQPSTKVTFNAGTATGAGVAERPVPAIMPAAGTATATSSVGAAAVALYVAAAIALATGEAFDGAGPNTPDALMLDYIVRRARPRLVALNRPDVVRRQRP